MSDRSASRLRWERRWHPLRGEWVVVAAHRDERPWSGESVSSPPQVLPEYDPSCHLCPGNVRVSGHRNPQYESVFVFDNDHPVVGPDAPEVEDDPGALCRRAPARGIARVVCYDPRHNVHLAQLPPQATVAVFAAWRDQARELARLPDVRHILFFENRGEVVGVSNPHPHCQVYAVSFTFRLVARELEATREHRRRSGRSLFQDILQEELRAGERIIAQNEHAVAFVPFFARYAYEVIVLPRAARPDLQSLADEEIDGLARVFHRVVCLYDALFSLPFPYVMAVHQAPSGPTPPGGFLRRHPEEEAYRVHIEIQPPLRRPGLRKHLAGPEIGGGNFMSDTWPEEKAKDLREAGRRLPTAGGNPPEST